MALRTLALALALGQRLDRRIHRSLGESSVLTTYWSESTLSSAQGSWFRVEIWELGLRMYDWGSAFGDWGLNFRVWGFGFGFWGLGLGA
jgi:hypothetical protein